MKPKISAERVYVSRTRGHPNGYGESPIAAYKNQEQRKAKQKSYLSKVKSLQDEIARLNTEREINLVEIGRLSDVVRRASSFRTDDTESWVLVASVVLKCSPSQAIKAMKNFGARVGRAEYEATERVNELISTWKSKLSISK